MLNLSSPLPSQPSFSGHRYYPPRYNYPAEGFTYWDANLWHIMDDQGNAVLSEMPHEVEYQCGEH